MRHEIATERYLQRHIEPGLPDAPQTPHLWQNVMVIPVYRESADFLHTMENWSAESRKTVVILVINRPAADSDSNANSELRSALEKRRAITSSSKQDDILALNENVDLYIHDTEQLSGPTPTNQGVGTARKIGCDIAFKWMNAGKIESPWIFCTDADATLPDRYFSRVDNLRTDTVAAIFPFTHSRCVDEKISLATALYELRLHHYVRGLQQAGSPYAFHSLGSCLAVRATSYAHCRGFPKRAGAEDFYLLNKLRKLGGIEQLPGDCIRLTSRASTRVPFGTGPAVEVLCNESDPLMAPCFYHPDTFLALGEFLALVPQLYPDDASLNDLLSHGKLEDDLITASVQALVALGLQDALEKIRRQSKNAVQFEAQVQRWFDGFRSLKFLHALRDASWPLLPLVKCYNTAPALWPPGVRQDFSVEELRASVYSNWGWQAQ